MHQQMPCTLWEASNSFRTFPECSRGLPCSCEEVRKLSYQPGGLLHTPHPDQWIGIERQSGKAHYTETHEKDTILLGPHEL